VSVIFNNAVIALPPTVRIDAGVRLRFGRLWPWVAHAVWGNNPKTVRPHWTTGPAPALPLWPMARVTSNAIPSASYGKHSGIITTVFEATQAFDQDGCGCIAQLQLRPTIPPPFSVYLPAFRHLARGWNEQLILVRSGVAAALPFFPANTFSDLKTYRPKILLSNFFLGGNQGQERTFLNHLQQLLHCGKPWSQVFFGWAGSGTAPFSWF